MRLLPRAPVSFVSLLRGMRGVVVLIGALGLGGTTTFGLTANSITLFETGFERFEGYDSQFDLAGQSGWVREGSGGNGLLGGPTPGFQGQVAYVGFNAPTNHDAFLNVWRPIGFTPVDGNLPVIRFSVGLQIQDSSTAAPYFDDFRWSMYGVDGHRFFSLDFDNDLRRVFYILDSASGTSSDFKDTHYSFQNGTRYDLSVVLDMAKNLWSASINGAVVANGQKITTTTNRLSLGDIDAVWAIRNPATPGDNFMIFDDYHMEVTPLTEIPPQLEVVGPSATSGAFVVKIWGEPGIEYSLEAATNLTDWTPLATGTAALADGSLILEDADAPKYSHRIYRARTN